MPARRGYPWLYRQLLTRSGADKDAWVRLKIDAALGDEEASAEVNRGEVAMLVNAGGEIG